MPETKSPAASRLIECMRVAALLLAVTCLAPAAAQPVDDDARVRDAVDAAILPLMARHDIPGMAIGLVINGQPHVFSYGVASKETGAPVTETTLFEIGSVSKAFTATLAAHAQAYGLLSLDEHPGKYLPSLAGTPIDSATLLHLGTYTAGGMPLQFPAQVVDEETAMAWFRDWQPSVPPGTRRDYTNTSLGLFGRIAAVALGGDFASLMQSRVFGAFGMADSFVQVPGDRMADYAWGYRNDGPVRVNKGPFDAEAYGVKTTASDLLRFVQANIDPAALEPAMRRAVETTQAGYFRAGPMVQGLGWERYAYPVSREWLLGGNAREMIFEPQPVERLAGEDAYGSFLFNKTGSTGGFAAYVAFVPARKIGIVMLANRGYPIPVRVEVALVLLEQLAPEAGRR